MERLINRDNRLARSLPIVSLASRYSAGVVSMRLLRYFRRRKHRCCGLFCAGLARAGAYPSQKPSRSHHV